MEAAIRETERRRSLQQAYNQKHGIVPKTILKKVADVLEISTREERSGGKKTGKKEAGRLTAAQKQQRIEQLTREMKAAAKLLEFEHAAYLRDQIQKLKNEG